MIFLLFIWKVIKWIFWLLLLPFKGIWKLIRFIFRRGIIQVNSFLLYGGIGFGAVALVVGTFFAIKHLLKRKEERDVMYWAYQDKWLLDAFDNNDVAVYGFRGSGKDALFAHSKISMLIRART